MVDKVFGQMEHKYNFYKYENIKLFGKEFKVKIVVESYDDAISDTQRINYQNYLHYITSNEDKIVDLIKRYFLEVYGQEIDVQTDLVPTTIYFSEDGSWGILFDTKIDEENGFAFFVQNGTINVGLQDIFL